MSWELLGLIAICSEHQALVYADGDKIWSKRDYKSCIHWEIFRKDKSHKVAFRNKTTQRYLGTSSRGVIECGASTIGDNETWELFEDGSTVSLKSHYGLYLCARPIGKLAANRHEAKDWEKFQLWKVEEVMKNLFILTDELAKREKELQHRIAAAYIGGEEAGNTHVIVEKALSELKAADNHNESKGKVQQNTVMVPVIELGDLITYCKTISGQSLETTAVAKALRLLSVKGQCLYFENPPQLADIVILDARFLTHEIMCSLFQKDTARLSKDGVIKIADLGMIWSGFSSRSDFGKLALKMLVLMEKFDMCFQLDADSYIIPNFLPLNPPEILREKGWAALPPPEIVEVNQHLVFNVLPTELMSKMLVKLHKVLKEQMVWGSGLYIEKEQCQAVLRIFPQKKRIRLSVRGKERKACNKLMQQITSEISSIVNSFSASHPGIHFQQKIKSPYIDLHDDDITTDSASLGQENDEMFDRSLVDLVDCLRDVDLKKEGQEPLGVICPKTAKKIDPELMLLNAGMLNELSTTKI